ncbi:MAG: DUF6054 family protein [Firmicutes bacterium]|nr:DUF6054 family protein [Bacillota bacterium]
MAGTTIRMTAERTHTLSDIHAKIHYIKGAEQIFHQEMHFDHTDVWLLVYEKYYLRVNSYATLTVLLTEQGETQAAQIVSSGGGISMSNNSLGTNQRFAKECVQALEEAGFSVDAKNSDALPKGLLERYFK